MCVFAFVIGICWRRGIDRREPPVVTSVRKNLGCGRNAHAIRYTAQVYQNNVYQTQQQQSAQFLNTNALYSYISSDTMSPREKLKWSLSEA